MAKLRVSPRRGGFLGVVLVGVAATSVAAGPAGASEPGVEFNRDVRPILSESCFPCHGPDAAKRKAKLRLDTEGGATADLGGRHAVVPGDPDASELYQRVTAEDDEERMPPGSTGR